MMKKLVLTLGCFALVVTFTGAAMADAITFTYSVTTATVPTIADEFGNPSLTGGPVGGEVTVKDDKAIPTLFLPVGSTGMVQSDNNTSYSAGALVLVATYAGGSQIQVNILSSYCPGGICLSGTNNFGTYTALKGDGGGFGGVFTVTYVNPVILAYFADMGESVNPNGGTAFTTTNNTWTTGGTTSSALFGSGTITIQTTPVPEPGTMALLGSGILGLAGVLRRKLL